MAMSNEPVDVLIIGAGASGAAIAWSLVETRMRILCLEQGPHVHDKDFPSRNADYELSRYGEFSCDPNVRKLPQDYPINSADSDITPVNFNGVGGSTINFLGHWPRLHPSDFRTRSLDGVADDWPVDYATLAPFYDMNDRITGVSGLGGNPAYPDYTPPLPPIPYGGVLHSGQTDFGKNGKNIVILLRLNWPEFSVGTESIYRSALSSRSLHFVGMNDAKISITLSEEERTALEAVCRRRKVEALVWKRARAFLLLDAGEDARTVCRILDIGPTVLTEWKSAFAAMGLSFFGLKDYSPRQGHLSFAQEAELKAHFSNTPPRNADEVCAHILAEYGQSYCSSGAAKLMSRLGFEYRKPQVLPTRAAEAAQEAFIAAYEALMRRLDDDEMVVFSDAVHPTHQSRPAHGWFPKDQKTAIKASSGRKRLNIQGAIDLETFQFTFVEAEKINARTTRQMLEKLELANPSMTAIHVFVDNARYHHAKVLQPWLNAPDRRVKLHFLPPYAPHLNPIERLWGVMHKWVTHNRHYATFNQFADAIMGFFRQTLPDKWHEFRDTVTDNFRVISLRKYKLI